ncbi:MAG: NAD(P)-binding domain-containing protein [Alphaproteobacteria bacterium]|nr:NAD(P)-binding domain-containing protein [Alphaproteobacteria bacterium]
MQIAIIGAGGVGGTLGRGLAAAGHEVFYGLRDPSAEAPAPLQHARARQGSSADAVAASEAVILATPWGATEQALRDAGPFGGRPLLDATNPLGPGLTLTHGHTDSGAEQVQRWAPSARVVKVFNTTGRENMADPRYPQGAALMLACGDDDAAVGVAVGLAADLGFDAHAFGPLRNARLLEPLARVWIELALVRGQGRGIALGLMRR